MSSSNTSADVSAGGNPAAPSPSAATYQASIPSTDNLSRVYDNHAASSPRKRGLSTKSTSTTGRITKKPTIFRTANRATSRTSSRARLPIEGALPPKEPEDIEDEQLPDHPISDSESESDDDDATSTLFCIMTDMKEPLDKRMAEMEAGLTSNLNKAHAEITLQSHHIRDLNKKVHTLETTLRSKNTNSPKTAASPTPTSTPKPQ